MKAKYKQPEQEPHLVCESPMAYYDGNAARPLYDLTSFEKMNIIKNGITKDYLEALKFSTGLDYDNLSLALAVTRATLINKKGEDTFSDQISERIVALADLYSFGYDVFEDKTKFNHWMQATNQALGGYKPLDIVDNYYGRDEVRHLIGRIAYGVFS